MTPIEFRSHIHAHPELSFREEQTARFIAAQLESEGIEYRTVAGTGILAKIEGEEPCDTRRAVVVRADIDALPVEERTECEWKSRVPGVMHACGHDVHSAVLFGMLQSLNRNRNFAGTVFGLFQPGEECNPGGASMVIAENPFEGYDVKAVVGSHTEAGMPVGTFGFCAGKFMASNDELRFTVNGRGGHAAMRDRITDCVTAAAELILRLSKLNGENCVVSTGRIEADGATNVIPDRVKTEGTMRTFDESLRMEIKRDIAAIAADVDAAYGTRTEVDINEGYPCVVNDPSLAAMACELAAKHFKSVQLPRRTTSEDFGRYGLHWPSLFFRFGVGENSGAAHTSVFAPDERAIAPAAEFTEMLVREILIR